MLRQCSWCGKDMGEKPPLEDKSVTDGICDECLEKVKGELNGNNIQREER
uniref:ClpX-type ZB domain-containing protein n=1 Tax=viral metagenome TaxID=1070528 RepID=A0A6M3JMM8_9ZZZZ